MDDINFTMLEHAESQSLQIARQWTGVGGTPRPQSPCNFSLPTYRAEPNKWLHSATSQLKTIT